MSEYEDNAKMYEDTAAFREDIRQADMVRAEQSASDHREVLAEMQSKSADDREAALQPLQRGERVLRRLAVGVAVLVFLFMSVVGAIAYDTSQEVIKLSEQNKALNTVSKQNSETNLEALELLKSCVVPEDPGTCYEDGQAGQGNAILAIVCYNYATNRDVASAAVGRAVNAPAPPGCDDFFAKMAAAAAAPGAAPSP